MVGIPENTSSKSSKMAAEHSRYWPDMHGHLVICFLNLALILVKNVVFNMYMVDENTLVTTHT